MAVDLSQALAQLEPLEHDQYFTAFGPAGQQFCGTPNGYCATLIPAKVRNDLLRGTIRKVLRASFGSEPDSFHFSYEMKDGRYKYRSDNLPDNIGDMFEQFSLLYPQDVAKLRVQLGEDGSYLVWNKDFWTSRGLPTALLSALLTLSSPQPGDSKLQISGRFGTWRVKNVSWHTNGTFFVQTDEPRWHFESEDVQLGWRALWRNQPVLPKSIAHVAFNPHSPTGGTFIFVKNKVVDDEPDFVLRFESESMILRLATPSFQQLADSTGGVPTTVSGYTAKDAQAVVGPTYQAKARKAVEIADHTTDRVYCWARAKYTGRPHTTDTWELYLKSGQRLKVLRDMGKNWFIAQNSKGERGWVHRIHLAFDLLKKDASEMYPQWKVDTEKVFEAGDMRSFPDLAWYTDACKLEVCQSWKKEGPLGICVHDLKKLLVGSGVYSLEYLKTERVKWHPDKFSRFCHADHREELMPKAEALFVLFGTLIDELVEG